MASALTNWLDERLTTAADTLERLWPVLDRATDGARFEIPDDLDVLDAGLSFQDECDDLKALWYHVREREGGTTYEEFRVVRPLMLTLIPMDVRGDSGTLARMRTVLRGVYGAGVELVYLVAGIYQPKRLGIVQLYGAIGRGATLEAAQTQAMAGGAAIEAAMSAAYPQIRFSDVPAEIAEWIFEAFLEMEHGILTVGHPDPRENARGGLADLNPMLTMGKNAAQQQYTLQQNEIVMRGMSQLEEDFLLQVILSPVSMRDAAQMLAGLSEYTSSWAAWQSGTRSFNVGLSVPMLLSGAMMRNAGTGYTANQSTGETDGISHTESQSHTDGQSYAHTEGHATTVGKAVTETEGVAITNSHSQTQGEGRAVTEGYAHSVTEGSATTRTQGSSHSTSVSSGSSSFASSSDAVNGHVGVNLGLNAAIGATRGVSSGSSVSNSVTHTSGGFSSTSQTSSHSETDTYSHSETLSEFSSRTEGEAVTRSYSQAETNSYSQTQSVADTNTVSQADTVGRSEGFQHSLNRTQGDAVARGLSRGFSNGLTIGIAPSVSVGESNQWQFDPAILLTQMLRQQQVLLDTITREGGFYTDVYTLARTERGKHALMALIPEAFHGTEDVVMGVQTRSLTPEEEQYLRLHARVMVPSTREIHFPEAMSAYADATLLTVLQSAAYMAPGLFEEGIARTVQEKIPPLAFDPNMAGSDSVPIGHQFSTERGTITQSLLRLARERHFHTALIGDTGAGKSVTAERLAYETTKAWRFRTIVLDFGQGWRKALNWPGMRGRVDIRQLYPGAVRPMRWNPLQVPKRVDPVRYRNLVIELFANAGRMGPRQLGFMREALTIVYANTGVILPDEDAGLFDDEQTSKRLSQVEKDRRLRHREEFKFVQNSDEEQIINAARQEKGFPERSTQNLPLQQLESFERQALAVHRSKRASLAQWVGVLRALLKKHHRDVNSRSSLQGVLLRLEPLAEGEMRTMYGSGYDTIAIEDLGLLGSKDDPWGVAVIEGGAEMDEFSKSALLSLIASILYMDAVVRRREALSGVRFPPMQIFFEEANKVLSGVDIGAASDSDVKGGNQTAQIFLNMWRDGRKYQVFLHVLAQTISELPVGILSSCNNGFFGQTKNDRDREAILAHLARNTKGFVNSEYDRFLARLPMAMAITKLGYTMEIADMEPYLIRSLLLPVREPGDRDIALYYKRNPILVLP